MKLLRLLSLAYARKHKLRTAITLAGITLGVAVFVAMYMTNRAILTSFRRTVDQIAGATQLQVSAGDFGFEEKVLEQVQAVPEVRVAVPAIEAVADTGIQGQGDLLILGVDMTGDRSLRDYDLESGEEEIIDDPLIFLAQPDSIIVTREFAQRNSLAVNSRLPLLTMEGRKEFVVRGIMGSKGFGRAFGGNVAVMDVYAAQKMFGRGQRFDRIDIGVQEGVSVEQCREAVQRAAGPGFEVEAPAARGGHFEALLASYTATVRMSSLLALFIGMFIIYNSFAIAVTQRRAEIGILRALGASQGQVRALFLGEGATMGVVGSCLGVAAGGLMARLTAGSVSGLLANIYGVAQQVEAASIEPALAAAGLALGIATSVFAAWIPSRAAARVDPVRALQKGKYQVLSAGENRLRRRTALVLAVAAAGCLPWSGNSLFFYASYFAAILSALLLAPSFSQWLSRLLRPVLSRLRPVEGALAADSLIQAPRRTSATVSALMLSLAMVIGFGGMAGAMYESVGDWMASTFNPDLFVMPSGSISSRAFAFPASFAAELGRLEGIEQLQLVRHARVLYRGSPVSVVSVELEKLAQKVRRRVLAGDPKRMYRLAAAGKGLFVSDTFAALRGVKFGEVVELPTPSGMLRLPVVGITQDYSDQQGSVLIDRSVYMEWWKDDSVNIIRVYAKPGVSVKDLRQRIQQRFAGMSRLFIFENSEVRSDILKWVDQWFGMTYNQVAVAALVAVLGIVNTLTVSIADRRRELGVLRAVGGLGNQVRHTIWMEAAGIGLIGLILGLALGALNLHYTLGLVRLVGGLVVDYRYPLGIALLLVPGMLATAFLSALWPAESAVRGSLVEALEYE